jgi:uncharacterized membrane protein affecting hemolysin expression
MDINLRISFNINGEALAAINSVLATILERLLGMSTQMDALTAQVAQTNTVEESAITLLQGLKAALDAAIASNDPAQLQALSDSLAGETAALSAAITANTPAA